VGKRVRIEVLKRYFGEVFSPCDISCQLQRKIQKDSSKCKGGKEVHEDWNEDIFSLCLPFVIKHRIIRLYE